MLSQDHLLQFLLSHDANQLAEGKQRQLSCKNVPFYSNVHTDLPEKANQN